MSENPNYNNISLSNSNSFEGQSQNKNSKIPQNISLPKQTALPLICFVDNKFIIPDEARHLLSSQKYDNIGIISLVGKYRTGKSFLLNRVLLEKNK